jgi:TRAP-type C4-dicarboxylate transport system permease small subunit
MERIAYHFAKILKVIAWVFLIAYLLFIVETAFIMSAISLVLWCDELGLDSSVIFFFIRISGFLLQFSFIMFMFAFLMRVIWRVMKSKREKLEAFKERKITEIKKQHSHDNIDKSRRKKK